MKLFVMLAVLATGPAPVQASAAAKDARAECSVREISRAPLSAGAGLHLYVEPAVAVESGDEILLAGVPTYLWDENGNEPSLVSHNQTFGVVVRRETASGRIVPAPIAGARLKPMAAGSIGPRAWGVIFAEIAPGTDTTDWWWSGDSTGSRLVSLWYGELRRGRWSGVLRLPLPGEVVRLANTNSAALVVRADTMIWAVPEYTHDSRYAAVLERVGRDWRHRRFVIDPRGAPGYVSLTHTPRHGFLMAVVDADLSLRRDFNSLFLAQRKRGEWTVLRSVAAGIEYEAHFPTLSTLGDSLLITWQTPLPNDRLQLLSLSGDLVARNAPVVPVDTTTRDKAWPIPGWEAGPYWIGKRPVAGGGRHLAIWRSHGGRIHRVWSVPDPYEGPFRLVSTGARDVFVTGPQLDPGRETLKTLLIHLQIDCSTRSTTLRR